MAKVGPLFVFSLSVFAWQAYEKGVDVHLQAEPTKAELLNKEFLSKEEEFRHSMKDSILEKYGGAEHLKMPPKELIFAQTVISHFQNFVTSVSKCFTILQELHKTSQKINKNQVLLAVAWFHCALFIS